MPIGSVRLLPGLDIEKTPTLNEAGFSVASLGRFKSGLFQKLGGWDKYYPFPVAGIPRALHAWQDLNAIGHLAVGSTTSLGIVTGGALTSITPQTLTSDFSPNFTTTLGSPLVLITDPNINTVTTLDAVFFNTPIAIDGLVLFGLYPITVVTGATSYKITASSNAVAGVIGGGAVPAFTTTNGTATVSVAIAAHGRAAGDTVVFPIATTGAGVTILGAYTVASVTSANAFTINVSTQATSGATFSMNGGNTELVYYINLGPAAAGSGFGLGGFGLGGFGTGVVGSVQAGNPITATDYTLDNWGQILIACPKNGGIYQFDPGGGDINAELIANAPTFCSGAFVAMPQRQIIAYGASTVVGLGIEQDPLLVRYCDVQNFNQWTAASGNFAGQYRLPTGSAIVGGLQGSQYAFLWTDLDLWAMTWLGYPDVWGFNKIGGNCGLIGPHARCQLGSTVYWMGRSGFFANAGEPIPCPVWDAIFQDLDPANTAKCQVIANTTFNEVWFCWPSLSSGTGECDKVAKFNTTEKTWDVMPLPRSAGIDESMLGTPIMASPQSIIYQHEVGADADGAPINAVMETGVFMIAEGHEMATVDLIWPDAKWGLFGAAQTAQLQITVKMMDYPGDTPRIYGPYTMTAGTQYVTTRARGRAMALRIESNDIGSFWRQGNFRFRYQSDGRR